MGLAATDPDGAREAYGAFYRRNAGWLLQIVRRKPHLMRVLGGEDGAADLVQDTFMRAFEKAETFDRGGISDRERISRRARAWLARIAKNLVLDDLRRGANPPSTQHIEELNGFDPPMPEEEATSAHAQQLREAIEKLSERDQDILWTWAQFYKPGEQHQRLPDDVSQALAARWNTTPEAIRQQRRRLFEMLRASLIH